MRKLPSPVDPLTALAYVLVIVLILHAEPTQPG
jgi:hypothetical protein